MTLEEKDLLLKDLSARLPYDVMLNISVNKYTDKTFNARISTIDYCGETKVRYGFEEYEQVFPIEQIKPYLFPLSSMTEEQEKELTTITDGKFRYMWGVITNAIPRKNISEWGTSENAFINGMKVINSLYIWLLKNHFDIYGLIPMGLAEDATNLNIY